MEDQEREYLKENMCRLEQWENTPYAPSGRSSDLTEVEKEKLIDLLFANNERLMSELSGLRLEIERLSNEAQKANEASARWEERTIVAEKRAESAEKRAESDRAAMQEKIDRLMTLVEQLRNGEELKAMLARAEKAEKMVADLIASDRCMRGQIHSIKARNVARTTTMRITMPPAARSPKRTVWVAKIQSVSFLSQTRM